MEEKVADKNYSAAIRDIMDLQRDSQFISQERVQAAISGILINSKTDAAAQLVLSSFKNVTGEELDLLKGQQQITRYMF